VKIVATLTKSLFQNPPIPKDSNDPMLKPLAKANGTVLECAYFAIANPKFDVLVPMLDSREVELHGFAYEGAGLGLAILDCWLPWKMRTRDFVNGPGAQYVRAVYLGVGLAFARMGRDPQRFRRRFRDPFWSWCVFDGYGFMKGIRLRQQYLEKCADPDNFRGYARRAFDQGLGRGLWFIERGKAERVAAVIDRFPENRRPDLWSGVGYACGYAGGGDRNALETLGKGAGGFRSSLAVGVAASARTRHLIGNLVEHNDIACEVLCGMSSVEAAKVAEEAMLDLPPGSDDEPAYEIWRRRLRDRLEAHPAPPLTS
jgi:hypothetical protein